MRTISLDQVIKTLCSQMGDDFGHVYHAWYSHAREWIRLQDQSSGGIPASIVVPITNGRAFIPEGMLLDRVGINVNGSFQPLLTNPNMLESECCGEFVPPDTGHPDWPAISSSGIAQFPADGFIDWWPSSGSLWTFWPGQGGGKSIYGYYKENKQGGYVFFDQSVAPNEEIILEGIMPTFSPRTKTLINELAVRAITSYCKWNHPTSKVDMNLELRVYGNEMTRYKSALNREPLCVMIAATWSGYGRMGV